MDNTHPLYGCNRRSIRLAGSMSYTNREEQREYQRKWVAARRAKWFSDKSCARCGSQEKLELDHLDLTTKVSHRIWSWSWARIEEEAAKCQVLCAPCHDKKCWSEDGRKRASHGSVTMYDHGCRCVPCKQAKSLKNARRQIGPLGGAHAS